MKTEIEIDGELVTIESDRQNIYNIHFPERSLKLEYKEDNEGAGHWIDLDKNDETEESEKIGEYLLPLRLQ